ncbi:MAG: hypothetical protein ACR2FJ_05520 [Qipengyuania sp.]
MIAAWAADAESRPDRIIAAGPGAAIWRTAFGAGAKISTDPAALDGMRCLLSGTGWASDFEHRARLRAKALGILSIAVLDHWVNYTERFQRNGAIRLPDRLWVGDRHASQLARKVFQTTPVSVFPNTYFERQAAQAGPPPPHGDILFVAEPARSYWGRSMPGEFQALDHFATNRAIAGIGETVPMRVRPHPSDPPGKYDAWIARHPRVSLDESAGLAEAMRGARWVAGLNSMALVIAARSGREAISALPPHAPPCALPLNDVRRL